MLERRPDSTEKQLAHLPEVLEVTARISTLNGSQREGMTIREDRMMGVRESIILDASLMEDRGLHLGDNVMLTLFYYCYAIEGSEIFADSGFFVVKDPFQLNALKAQMHDEVKFLSVIVIFIGYFAAAVFLRPAARVLVLSGAMFFLAFLDGAAMAILALHRLSVMEMLIKRD